MPTVWIRDDPKYRARFHRSYRCRQLRKKPSRGQSRGLLEVDLNDVHVRPCKTCYPDVPTIPIIKRYCTLCQSPYACEHNGGVLISDRADRHYWVWPDTNQMPLYRMTS